MEVTIQKTIQKNKIIQALDDIIEIYESETVTREELDKLLCDVILAVEGEYVISNNPSPQTVFHLESISEKMRKVKDESIQQFLIQRGSLY